jgi:hypothetical protein
VESIQKLTAKAIAQALEGPDEGALAAWVALLAAGLGWHDPHTGAVTSPPFQQHLRALSPRCSPGQPLSQQLNELPQPSLANLAIFLSGHHLYTSARRQHCHPSACRHTGP